MALAKDTSYVKINMVTNHISKQGGNPKWIKIVYHIHRGIVSIT